MKRILAVGAVVLVIGLLFWTEGRRRARTSAWPAATRPAVAATAAPPPAQPGGTPSAPAIAPPQSGPLAEERLLARARTRATREVPTARPDTITRLRLIEAEFKYPLLRVEETVRAGAVVARTEAVADHVIVKVRPEAEPTLADAVAAVGGTIRQKLYSPRTYLVAFAPADLDTVPRGIAALQQVPGVEYAEADYIVHALDTTPDDPEFGLLWGLHNTGQTVDGQVGTVDADIDAPAAWDVCTGSSNLIVAVIDTGIDYNHEDLAANQWRNAGETPGNGVDDDGNGFVDDVFGWDFCNQDSDPFDDHFHGTHCAGTIGGAGHNSTGVAGVNWSVQLMALKFLNSGGSGSDSDAADAVRYATKMKARLSSNSWGGGSYNQTLFEAIAEAGASNSLFIAAAGNDSKDTDSSANYPSCYTNDNLIAVAATDNQDRLASFSNYGRTTVDLGAPGVKVYSCKPDHQYQYLSGTSMATPHVAGACALAWAFNPNADAATLKAAILAGAEPITALSNKCVTGARLNVFNTLRALGMFVAASAPRTEEIVSAPPVDYAITFSDAYTTGTVAAADFSVDGVAADSVTPTTDRTVTFHFNTAPVTNEGPHTMALPAGAVTRAFDGHSLTAWSATWYYDAVPLTVTSTAPTNGATVQLPLTDLVLNFSEPFVAGTAGADDLQLNQGDVSGATVLGPAAVAYRLTHIVTEGPLTIRLGQGALRDAEGNPNVAYAGSLDLDYHTIAFPATLRPLNPPGSLILRSDAVPATVSYAGDTDQFTLDLGAGQTLSVLVRPATHSLQPSVELRAPDASVAGAATAGSAGQPAFTPPVPTSTGAYTIAVTGAGGSTGGYTVQVFINTALEAEQSGGAANDSHDTAQDLDPAFIAPGQNLARAAVLGHGTNTEDWFAFTAAAGDQISVVAEKLGGADPAIGLYDTGGVLRGSGVTALTVAQSISNYVATTAGRHAVRVAGGAGEYVVLVLRNSGFDLGGNETFATAQDITGQPAVLGSSTPAPSLFVAAESSLGSAQAQRLNPRTGAALGSAFSVPAGTSGGVDLAFDGASLWHLTGDIGTVTVRQLDPTSGAQLDSFAATANLFPRGLAYCRGELFVAETDELKVYSAATHAYLRSVPLPMFSVDGIAGDDASGSLYVVYWVLNKFYQIDAVSGAPLSSGAAGGTSLSLWTRDLATAGSELFVSERNITGGGKVRVFSAGHYGWQRDFTPAVPSGWNLAGIGGDNATSPRDDWYRLSLTNGQTVALRTHTPGLTNAFDPALQLYDASQALVAADDNGAGDGRNAQLTCTATASGSYRVRVYAMTGTRGEYLLTVNEPASVSPWEQWRAQKFTPAELLDPATSGAAADPEADGLNNLLEYALGCEPKTADTGWWWALENDHLTLTYTRRVPPCDVSYAVEATDSLAGGWSGAGLSNAVLGNDSVLQTNKAIDGETRADNPSRFMRLKVSQP
jgi:subtilisin family serine protease